MYKKPCGCGAENYCPTCEPHMFPAPGTELKSIRPKKLKKEFPDGGRATHVRRYSPPLTRRQLGALFDPSNLERRLARALEEVGLLEKVPRDLDAYRLTGAGEEVVLLWRLAGFKPL